MKGFSIYMFFFLLMVSFHLEAQDLPRMCGGSTVRYATAVEKNWKCNWEIVGGTIVSNYNDSVDILWNNEDGIHTIKITAESPTGCITSPQYGYVMVSKVGKLFSTSALQICDGDSIQVRALAFNASILWDNGSTDSSIFIRTNGYHQAEALLPSGCKVRDSILLEVHPRPVFSLGNDTILCKGDQITLHPGIQGVSYKWSTGESNPYIQVDANSGLVWAEVSDEYGCSFTDTLVIHPCKPSPWNIKVPNAFTPNGDNDNDTWRIALLDDYPEASVFIYNRWGQLVFKSENNYPILGWDGTCNGKPLPMSTYYYVIDLKNGTSPLVGSVNLIR